MNNLLLVTNDQNQINRYLADYLRAKQIPPGQIFRFDKNQPLTVEEFRQILKLTQINFSQPALFVLERFDRFSPIIQNTFLKTLEEHQATVSFILTAINHGGILPTILSRCIVKTLPEQKPALSTAKQNEWENTLAHIKKSGLASAVVKLGLKDKKEKALDWLQNFLQFGYQVLPLHPQRHQLSKNLKQAIINYGLINNNNLDPETALDQVFLC